MDLGIEEKVAWVLGGSSGLGLASAETLAAEGAQVAISARNEPRLVEAARRIADDHAARCVAVPVDASDAGSIARGHEAVVDQLGAVDILVANAGGPPPGSFEDLDDTSLQAAFELTLASAWRFSRLVIPSMRERGGGCLLYITSSSTKEVIPGLVFSNTLRAGVVGMAKTLSKEAGGDGIRVCCVAPGKIDTPRLRSLTRSTAERTGRDAEEIGAEMTAGIPLGRVGNPKEFGDVVAFLASERASYVSGVTVVVDGGLLNGILS